VEAIVIDDNDEEETDTIVIEIYMEKLILK